MRRIILETYNYVNFFSIFKSRMESSFKIGIMKFLRFNLIWQISAMDSNSIRKVLKFLLKIDIIIIILL